MKTNKITLVFWLQPNYRLPSLTRCSLRALSSKPLRQSKDKLTLPRPNQRVLWTSVKEPRSSTKIKMRRARKMWVKSPLNHLLREWRGHSKLIKTSMWRGYPRDQKNQQISRTMLPKTPNLTKITRTCFKENRNLTRLLLAKFQNQVSTVTNNTDRDQNISLLLSLTSIKSIFQLIQTYPSRWLFRRDRRSVII